MNTHITICCTRGRGSRGFQCLVYSPRPGEHWRNLIADSTDHFTQAMLRRIIYSPWTSFVFLLPLCCLLTTHYVLGFGCNMLGAPGPGEKESFLINYSSFYALMIGLVGYIAHTAKSSLIVRISKPALILKLCVVPIVFWAVCQYYKVFAI